MGETAQRRMEDLPKLAEKLRVAGEHEAAAAVAAVHTEFHAWAEEALLPAWAESSRLRVQGGVLLYNHEVGVVVVGIQDLHLDMTVGLGRVSGGSCGPRAGLWASGGS